jgi:hypothetical protein
MNLSVFQVLRALPIHILTHLSYYPFHTFLGDEVVSSRSFVVSDLSEPHVTQTEKHLE